jgi:hypothetical protein
VLKAVGDTETTQGNVQDWLKLNEGDPGFELLTERNYSDFLNLFLSVLYTVTFSIYFFFFFFLFFMATFAPVIRIIG